MRAAVLEILPEGDDQIPELLATIENAINDLDASESPETDDLPSDVVSLAEILERHYQPLADMSADNASYWHISGIEAARMFVSEWDGIDFDLRRGLRGLDQKSLEAIPDQDFASIGIFAHSIMAPSMREKKGLESPSTTPSDPTISKASETP